MLLASAACAEPQRWYAILAENGALIGHASRETVTGPDTIRIIDSQSIDLYDEGDKRPQAPWFSASKSTEATARTVLTEDKTGDPIAISTESQNGPEWREDWTRIEAKIAGDTADITRTTPLETRHFAVALPRQVRFDGGEGLLATLAPGQSIEFANFNAAAMAVERVVLEARGETSGGMVALRKRYDGSQLLAISKFVVGREGAIVESVQPLFGASLTIKATDKQTALAAHSPYHALPAAMTKSPYRISATAMRGHIRYRFAFKDGLEFALPQTSEQRVTAEPGAVTVDICADCGPGLPTDAAALADARKPTAWMQSDARALKDIAEPIARLPVSDSRKMELLAQKVKTIMVRLDFTGHYSALETIERRSGDCTEASVLLAAFGRAAGIPTRVANGLVYSREAYHGVSNSFLPHSWTLAFADGKWTSFDSALDAFDSTHIALTVGDGDARSLLASMQLAGLLQWQGFAEVRSPD
jgi:hypothetical protein